MSNDWEEKEAFGNKPNFSSGQLDPYANVYPCEDSNRFGGLTLRQYFAAQIAAGSIAHIPHSPDYIDYWAKRVWHHRVYEKHGEGLEWLQYQRMIYRVYSICGLTLWWKTLARCDRPMHHFIRKCVS